jgi:hypothetical protein
MIDPLRVPIIFSLGGIDPPGVPVRPLIEDDLPRGAYTFLELPSVCGGMGGATAAPMDRMSTAI